MSRLSCLQLLRYSLPHFALLIGVVVYVLIGAALFYALERPNELHQRQLYLNQTRAQVDAFSSHAYSSCQRRHQSQVIWNIDFRKNIEQLLTQWDKAAKRHNLQPSSLYMSSTSDSDRWSYGSAVLFAFTLITTIGYGNVFPVTVAGRVLCIVYALIGVPLTLITVANLGKFLAAFLVYLMRRLRCCCVCSSITREKNNSKSCAAATLTEESCQLGGLIIVLVVVYLLIGTICYSVWEGLDFFAAFYFVFVTLFTIGLGDIFPQIHSFLFVFIIYILFGLALISLILVMAAMLMRKIHYNTGPQPARCAAECTVWFGAERVYVGELVRAIADYSGLSAHDSGSLLADLDDIVQQTIAEKHGKMPTEIQLEFGQRPTLFKHGLMCDVHEDSVSWRTVSRLSLGGESSMHDLDKL